MLGHSQIKTTQRDLNITDEEMHNRGAPGPWSRLTVQVWPPSDGARWPPPMGLNGEPGLDALAERFAEIETMAI